jgi:probable rRNA maturation factor
MKLSLDISVASALWRRLPHARAMARETIAACIAESEIAMRDRADVSLCLADDKRLRALNARWRGVDKPTNVLSFPSAPTGAPAEAIGEHADQARRARLDPDGAADPSRVATLGDIALAYETLAREAQDFGAPLADHYRHLLAHGFLHLLGYDHVTDEDAQRMEAIEIRILARLGVPDPYARGAADV